MPQESMRFWDTNGLNAVQPPFNTLVMHKCLNLLQVVREIGQQLPTFVTLNIVTLPYLTLCSPTEVGLSLCNS